MNRQQALLAQQGELNPASSSMPAIPPAPATTGNSSSSLSPAEQEQVRQQIKDLQQDMRQKLGEMASVYERDGYAKAVSSQSSFRDSVADDADKIAQLQDQLGVQRNPGIQWIEYYPYYVYPFAY
jgi:beta-lactamase class A